MEGVPWSKPSVLHAARRLADGGAAYEDRLVRARLAQAFGRLIRSSRDRGAFVLLSAAMPSRLLAARSEEHTSKLQSLMRISYAVFCLKKKKATYFDLQIHIVLDHTSLALQHAT